MFTAPRLSTSGSCGPAGNPTGGRPAHRPPGGWILTGTQHTAIPSTLLNAFQSISHSSPNLHPPGHFSSFPPSHLQRPQPAEARASGLFFSRYLRQVCLMFRYTKGIKKKRQHIFTLDSFRRHKKIQYKHKSLDNFMIKTNTWETDSFECR